MKKRIVPSEINKVSIKIKENNESLTIKIKKLREDVDKISLYYQGVDANLLISNYNQRIDKIEKYLVNYQNLKTYFSNMSSLYEDTITETKKQLDTIKENYDINYDTINNEEGKI